MFLTSESINQSWIFIVVQVILEGKYSLESTDPCKSEIRAHLRPYFSVEWVELRMYYLFIMRQVICWFAYIGNWFVYIGKNPRFTAFLDSNLHTRLVIVTENELGLAFHPGNLPQKISSRSVNVLFSYRCNKQTDKHQCWWLHNPSRKLLRG